MQYLVKTILARFAYLMRWEGRIYGYLSVAKKFIKLPGFLPLYVHLEHGWDQKDEIYNNDLNTGHKIILTFNERRRRLFASHNIKPIVMGCPMLMYIKMHSVKKSSEACGTIVFPAKGGNFVKEVFDIRGFCENLKNLPSEYHPITICLTDYGMNEENNRFYKSFGFDVVTAGYHLSPSFTKRFCELLPNFKYASSNIIGTYVLPCIELGIPFFLLRNGNVTYENDGRDEVHERLFSYEPEFNLGHKTLAKAYELFEYKHPVKITDEQLLFVQEEAGASVIKSPYLLLAKVFFALLPFYYRQFKESIRFGFALMQIAKHFKRCNKFAIYGAGKSGKNLNNYLVKYGKSVSFMIDDRLQDGRFIVDCDMAKDRVKEVDAIFLGTSNFSIAKQMQQKLLKMGFKKPIFYSPTVAYMFEAEDEWFIDECSSVFCEIESSYFDYDSKIFIETAKFEGYSWSY